MDNITLKKDIIAGVLAEFYKLAEIPRPSGHEKAVSDYLKELFLALGYQPIQDEALNIIVDIPASEDMKNAPLVVLQAHMDMVCIANAGVSYNPLTDPIQLELEGNILHGKGTSIGADDGIGIAIITYLVKNQKQHGPLRLIFTVDEEDGMSGAIRLDSKWLMDATYLVNCDSEEWDLLTVGSAGHLDAMLSKEVTKVPVTEKNTYKISCQGFKGGHSGTEINNGLANGIVQLALCLEKLKAAGKKISVSDFSAGTARNVIPSKGYVIFNSDASYQELQLVLDDINHSIKALYGEKDDEAHLVLEKMEETSSTAIDEASLEAIISLLLLLKNGVIKMSAVSDNFVETSANIGVAKLTDKGFKVDYMPRSSKNEKLEEIKLYLARLAKATAFTLCVGGTSPGWAERKDSKIVALMEEIFAEQNDRPVKKAPIHAGLECSWHFKKNPDLDIVSIGTNNRDIHTPKESLEVETIFPQVRLLQDVLKRI